MQTTRRLQAFKWLHNSRTLQYRIMFGVFMRPSKLCCTAPQRQCTASPLTHQKGATPVQQISLHGIF